MNGDDLKVSDCFSTIHMENQKGRFQTCNMTKNVGKSGRLLSQRKKKGSLLEGI